MRVLSKWQVVEEQGLGYNKTTAAQVQHQQSDFGPVRRRISSTSCDNTLDPKSKRGRVTIQTDKGPKDVSRSKLSKLYNLGRQVVLSVM